MTIAVMFEASGRVRDALIARGYDAVSIDIRPTQSPGPHIVGDCFDHLNDGWSGAIMFPTCTYVCGSGFHWNHRVVGRNLMTDRAVWQFRRLMECRIPRKIAENPVGVLDMLSESVVINAVIQGDCPTGADKLARMWAISRNHHLDRFPADWNAHGRAAGPIRNQEMIDKGRPTMGVVFPGGRGTADMVRRLKAADVEVRQFYPPLSPGEPS